MADFYSVPLRDSMIATAREYAGKVFETIGVCATEQDLNTVATAILSTAVKASLSTVQHG